MFKESPLVVVVDDDEAIRKALSRLLRSWKFRVESFSSGREFLNSLQSCEPDCVVLDLHMPDMNGLEVLRALRAGKSDLPVIVITAHDEAGVRTTCLVTGASAYLCKPIDGNVLRPAIIDAIR
jgi:FixJ family two-component response regulator